jgi:hypothetical protein
VGNLTNFAFDYVGCRLWNSKSHGWPSLSVAWASAAVLANMISYIMIGKINERLPESERISYIWWGTEVRKRFKELYPGNRLVLLLDSCMVVLIVSFILGLRFWVFG